MQVINAEETAKLLGKGIATIWRWIRDGKLLAVRVGGRIVIISAVANALAGLVNQGIRDTELADLETFNRRIDQIHT